MKHWTRPSIVVIINEQLNEYVLAFSNSNCILRHIR